MVYKRIIRRRDVEEMNRGIGMLEAVRYQWHVSGVLRVAQNTVVRMWEWFQTHGNVNHRHSGGREGVKIQYEDRFIFAQERRQCFYRGTAL